MTTNLRQITFIILTVLQFSHTYGQDTTKTNFFDQIKTYDLTTIWTADSILIEDSKEKVKRMEPIGFIGDNYQRFYIHFNSIIKKSDSPYEYSVYGKTRVKETICEFIGTINIIQAKTYNEGDMPKYKQGFTICEVKLYEDNNQSSAGVITGKLTTSFIIDDMQKFRYDALNFGADGFSNNEFKGTWRSYKTNISKKCNWGDYRIPESDNFDIGAGQFSVDDKYLKNGWENYRIAYMNDPDKIETIRARQIEDEHWWK